MKNTISTFHLLMVCFIFLSGSWLMPVSAQETYTGNNFVTLKPGSTEQEISDAAAKVTPSPRQLAWQRLETTAFIHFGLNTFYNQEWGRGTEDPARFNPTLLNTDQWAKVLSETGFKMLIMTCKHHDGLCMWPSKFTEHDVAASPWLGGKGDLVKEVAESCRKYNLKFGVYLSPWDRHEPSYGNSPEYNKFFLNQLTELLTNYGKVDEVWFDGACGEGPNGKKQVYDWLAFYSLIRKLQPEAVIAVMGPDVRWVGTESGYGRETEWSVVPYELTNQEKIAEGSQQAALKEGFTPPCDMESQDLGSRSKIREAKSLIWYPSEVDVSIRPGWFWHESENGRVKTPEKLLDIYFSSVGRNSLLLLNIPPDTNGLINDADISSLRTWKSALESIFKNNFAKDAKVINADKTLNFNTLTDNNDATSWNFDSKKAYSIELELKSISEFNVLLLQENISIGQRIEHFTLEAWVNNNWKQVTEGTTVGFKRLLRFPTIKTNKVRLTIDKSRLEPALAEIGLYRQLPVVTSNPSSASFTQSVQVELTSTESDAKIYYTTDGSIPDKKSKKYKNPLTFNQTTELQFVAIRNDGTSGFRSKSSYQKAEYGITLVNAPDEKYNGGGPLGLVDGATGSIDFADGRWSGFNGTNLEAVIDLGTVKELNEFQINFNESTKSWIFRPQQVEFAVSEDGKSYRSIFTKTFEKPTEESELLLKVPFSYNCKARYIKVIATNFGKIPDWHPGKGEPAWLFADEIIAR
jgi:alpha-L-fucosidase